MNRFRPIHLSIVALALVATAGAQKLSELPIETTIEAADRLLFFDTSATTGATITSANLLLNRALTTGNLSQFANTTSAQLAGVISNETGSGALAFGTSPTLATPVINVGSDATGDIYYRSAGGAFTRLGVGSNGNVLTLASGLPSWAAPAGGGLTVITETLNTASPNNSKNAASLVVTGGTTDNDLVIAPKGNGALIVEIPNSAISGGNKRGAFAVDLQLYRDTDATAVASGSNSTVSGGANNTASGAFSTVIGGLAGTATSQASAVLGGSSNTATNSNAVTVGGANNTASGVNSLTVGGERNTASGSHSHASGFWSTTAGLYGKEARATGRFSSPGDAQAGRMIFRRQTTDATVTVLTADDAAASTTNTLVLPNNSAFRFRAHAIARNGTTGDVKSWVMTGTIKRGANAAATAFVGTPSVASTDADAGATTWALNVLVNTTNGSLEVSVTGVAATTIRWVATIETVEIQ